MLSTDVEAEIDTAKWRRLRTVSHLTMRPPMWPGMIMRTGKPWSGVSHLPFCLYATCGTQVDHLVSLRVPAWSLVVACTVCHPGPWHTASQAAATQSRTASATHVNATLVRRRPPGLHPERHLRLLQVPVGH